jgi:hypothetical protein
MNVISRMFFRDFRALLPEYNFFRLLPHGRIGLDDSALGTELFAYQNIVAFPRWRSEEKSGS